MTALVVVVVVCAVVAATILVLRSGSAPAPKPLALDPPSKPVPSQHADPFGAAAAALASRKPGKVLAAVYDVTTGQEWELGRGSAQAEASVVKLDILETLLAQHRGADLTTAQRMMEYSDNDSATTLWYATGGPGRIGSYNTAAGLRGTRLSRCVDCPGFPWPGWGLSTTTPADQIALLRQLISPRSLLTASQRRFALGLMEHVTSAQSWGVSGGVPAGVTVALKNGWLPLDSADDDWQVNSVGWVSGEGRDYLMAVLTTGSETEKDGIDLIGKLSAMVWHAMER